MTNKLPILNILCGVPGSGKSTYAKLLEFEGFKVLSSDAFRQCFYGNENDQSHNSIVFECLYKVAVDLINNGESVVIDATNINIKTRRKALEHFKHCNCIKVCTVICTPPMGIKINDANRERNVGADVIDKYIASFEIPMKEEGFDYIDFYYSKKDVNALENLELYLCDFALYYDQNNEHHSHTLGEHCLIASNLYIADNHNYDKNIADALLYHDIGKPYTMTFDENKVSHYFGHANYGAYICVCSQQFRLGKLSRESVFLINHHMKPYSEFNDKSKKLFGEEIWKKLEIVHKYDKESH